MSARTGVRATFVTLLAGAAIAALPAPATAAGMLRYDCAGGTTGYVQINGGSAAQSFTAAEGGRLLTVELRNIARSPIGAGSEISVAVYGADESGNLVDPVLASTTIPSASVTNNGVYQSLTANFSPDQRPYLEEGEIYGVALTAAGTAETIWGYATDNPCAGSLLKGGPPYTPFLPGPSWDAGIAVYQASASDDFARARKLQGSSVLFTDTTAGATREPGEPLHDSLTWPGDHSVWFEWTAPGSGPASVNTCAAAIDSVMSVYVGDVLPTLERIGNNNNASECGGGWGSYVSFDAVAGTRYKIAVGDAGGLREAEFTLGIIGPPNDPPQITGVKPAPKAKVKALRPVIKATVSDSASALDAGALTLTLDGIERAFTYDAATGVISFKPPKLKPGRHKVRVTAEDELGGRAAKSWSFQIKKKKKKTTKKRKR